MQRLSGLLGSFGVFVVATLASCGGNDLVLPNETSPADLSLIKGNNQSGPAGEPLADSLVVKVLDRRGQALANARVAFSLVTEATGAHLSPDTVQTGEDGVAQSRWVLGSVSGTQTAVARVVGANLEVRFNATVGAAGASRIERVSGDGQLAPIGSELQDPLVVLVTDGFGNPVAGVAVEWTAQQGTVDPGSTLTGADGRAVTTWNLGSSVGSQTATATSPGLEGSPLVFTATGTSGGGSSPSRLEFQVQPSDTREDRRISPAVEVVVLDAAGDRYTGPDIEIKLELSGDDDGELDGDRTERTRSGVATFSNLKVDHRGDYRLHASAEGLPTVDSRSFRIFRNDHDDD